MYLDRWIAYTRMDWRREILEVYGLFLRSRHSLSFNNFNVLIHVRNQKNFNKICYVLLIPVLHPDLYARGRLLSQVHQKRIRRCNIVEYNIC